MESVVRTMKLLVAALLVTGLGAFGYSSKRDRFEMFKVTTIYTIAVITTFCLVYLGDIVRDITSNNFDLNDVNKMYSYMNIAAGLLAYVTYFCYAQRQTRFLNEGRKHLIDVCVYLSDGQAYRSQVIQVGIKALLFPALLQSTLVARSLHFEPDKSILWTYYSLIPYVIRTAPATSVYGTMLLATALFQSINTRLLKIVTEVSQMQTHKEWLLKTPFHRMQRYCDLSDEIDSLNEKYTIIIEISNELLEFSALPWLGSILCNVVGIILGLYTQYTSVADTIFNGKEFDWYNVITDSSFMVISFMEIYTQSDICSTIVEEIRQTGIILQRADSIDADVRYRQAVDFFSLRILQRNYKIKPLGLFEVDASLVHGVFSTATGFLLILIQSDLSRRFLQ